MLSWTRPSLTSPPSSQNSSDELTLLPVLQDHASAALEADHGWSFEQSDTWLEHMGLFEEEF